MVCNGQVLAQPLGDRPLQHLGGIFVIIADLSAACEPYLLLPLDSELPIISLPANCMGVSEVSSYSAV